MGSSELEQWVTGQGVIGSWVNKMLYGSMGETMQWISGSIGSWVDGP